MATRPVNVVPLKEEELQKAGIWFKPMTLYRWHSIGEHSNLFIKVGRKLLINVDEYNKWIRELAAKKGGKND